MLIIGYKNFSFKYIAVCILLETFSQFDDQIQKDIFDFIIQQTVLQKQDWPYKADVNLLRLIVKVTEIADKDSCATLASSIFPTNSLIWIYRFLTMKSIPVVQQVYQAI
jgi:hypothetical protein